VWNIYFKPLLIFQEKARIQSVLPADTHGWKMMVEILAEKLGAQFNRNFTIRYFS